MDWFIQNLGNIIVIVILVIIVICIVIHLIKQKRRGGGCCNCNSNEGMCSGNCGTCNKCK